MKIVKKRKQKKRKKKEKSGEKRKTPQNCKAQCRGRGL